MGGVGRRRKKEEKTKTQLKKPKTAPGKHLPKGTNVTKTEFKVGKIVIPKQMQLADQTGPLTKKKLGLKDVLGKLSHFSQSVRTDSLDGLKELITGEFGGNLVRENLADLVTRLSPLTSDREHKIRRTALAILEAVLGQADVKCLEPLYNILVAHLSCSLTHIEPGIQRDGLNLIDSLTQVLPQFLAEHYSTLLPDCLEQISSKKVPAAGAASSDPTKGSSGLAANLSESLTAVQWRIDVLRRVEQILQAVVAHARSKSADSSNTCLNLEFKEDLWCGVYPNTQDSLILRDLRSGGPASPLLPIIHRILPLIIETMVEVTASSTNKKSQARPGFLTRESSALLASVASILDILLQLGEEEEGSVAAGGGDEEEAASVLSVLRSRYSDQLFSRIVSHVPYSSSEGKCDRENLQLCSLYLTLTSVPNQEFLRKIVNIVKQEPGRVSQGHVGVRLRVIRQLLRPSAAGSGGLLQSEERGMVVSSLLSLSTSLPLNSRDRLQSVDLLASLVGEEPEVDSWLTSLPAQLLSIDSPVGGGEILKLCSVLLTFSQQGNRALGQTFIAAFPQLQGWLSELPPGDWKPAAEQKLHFIHQNFKLVCC